MKIFHSKCFFKSVLIITMIFSLFIKANAEESYKNNVSYRNLNSIQQNNINLFHHHLLSTLRDCDRRNQVHNDFKTVLDQIDIFLSQYDTFPPLRQCMVRIIGVSSYKSGYIVNIYLFSQFIGIGKSCINAKFQRAGFSPIKIHNKEKLKCCERLTGCMDFIYARHWTFRSNKLSKNNIISNNSNIVLPPTNAITYNTPQIATISNNTSTSIDEYDLTFSSTSTDFPRYETDSMFDFI